jgi:hypothetical protein
MTGDKAPDVTDRREFLRVCARWGLLGGIGALAVRLLRRDEAAPSARQCANAGVCRGCPALPECELPDGTMARRGLGRMERRS